MKYLLLPSLRT